MENLIQTIGYHSKGERNGFLLLMMLLVLAISLNIIFSFLLQSNNTDFASQQNTFSLLEQSLTQPAVATNFVQQKKQPAPEKQLPDKNSRKVSIAAFDPNIADKNTLTDAGISPRVADNIIKYRNAGGKFKTAKDLSKIYGMSAEKTESLMPFLNFPKAKEKTQYSTKRSAPERSKIAPFPFDPNTADIATLTKLGLPEKVISTINNYRNKKGTFRSADDFSKVYGLSADDFLVLKPFITIEKDVPKKNYSPAKKNFAEKSNKEFTTVKVKQQKVKKEPVFIDINKAGIEDWKKLKGIGDWYATKIVELRDNLGGFAEINQISETFSLPDSTFQAIKPFLVASPPSGEKIKLNSGTVQEIKHPYLSWKLAKIIVAYREEHGPFTDVQELKKIKILKEETFNKVLPYLSLD